MALEQKAQIMDRILSLKDYSPFILICDSLAQTADHLLAVMKAKQATKRELVVISDLGSIENVGPHLQSIIRPGVSVVGVFHTDDELKPSNTHNSYAPYGLPLLEYMATSIIRVIPGEAAQQRLADEPVTGPFDFSGSVFNRPVFRVEVEHRRKTGRSLTGLFDIDARANTAKFVSPQAIQAEDGDLPENLTTFNLSLSEKQRKNRENVELPFMEAQQGPDGGGAIIYEFEKEDDYDEDDPYEDPF